MFIYKQKETPRAIDDNDLKAMLLSLPQNAVLEYFVGFRNGYFEGIQVKDILHEGIEGILDTAKHGRLTGVHIDDAYAQYILYKKC